MLSSAMESQPNTASEHIILGFSEAYFGGRTPCAIRYGVSKPALRLSFAKHNQLVTTCARSGRGHTLVKQELAHTVSHLLAFAAMHGLPAPIIPTTPAPLAISGVQEA